MIARQAIFNPWVFREFLPACASDTVALVTDTEMKEAVVDYGEWSRRVQTKPKYVIFHKANFERLISRRSTSIADIPKSRHLS